MKKAHSFILILLAIICLFGIGKTTLTRVYAYDEDVRLSVFGEAKKEVKSDIVNVMGTIETYNADNENMSTIYSDLIKQLNDIGIDNSSISTLSCLSSYRQCDYMAPVYYLTLNFEVTVSDTQLLNKVCETVSNTANCKINSLNYECKDISQIYDEVLTLAIDNAKSKANNVLKNEMQAKHIFEQPTYTCNSVYKDYITNAELSESENITISARVKVVFE